MTLDECDDTVSQGSEEELSAVQRLVLTKFVLKQTKNMVISEGKKTARNETKDGKNKKR